MQKENVVQYGRLGVGDCNFRVVRRGYGENLTSEQNLEKK